MSIKRGKLDATAGIGSNTAGIVELRVDGLKPMPGAPRTYSKDDIARAKPVVAHFGDRAWPVLVDDDDHVISGGVFVAAARALGRKTLLVVRQSGLTSLEAMHFGTAIDKLQTLGGWDPAAMEAVLRDFEKFVDDFSPSLIGFAPGELDKLIGASRPFETGGSSKLEERAVSWLGATWRCGDHLVLCGDATSEETMDTFLAGQQVSVSISDPPFGCKVDGFVSKKGKHRDFVQGAGELDDDALLDFFRKFCRSTASVLKPGALVYLFIDWRSLRLLQQAGEEVFGKLINLCVWAKDRAGMGSFYRSQHELVLVFAMPGARHLNNVELGRHGRDRSNLWSYASASSSRRGREGDQLKGHPTPKNVEMLVEAIIDSSLRGQLVLDCFLGSGTTLIAAERSGRICRGIDLDPLYVDLAVRRWQDWTGQDAIDVASGRTFNEIAQEADDAEVA